ncbi:hypothetical protein NHX12_009202 [Muraenolepis orangiensis]|uniref:Cilia- and flagella-associated protein 45 n=2 Tax=Muraenolepis orangiensis TaxID=630683 RepID=A0A9Q0DPC2_9TELE|nr:hypothetical protein NHX12_009202 [Muraenolepis orangiensis]
MEKDFQSAPKRFWQTIRRLRRGKRGSIQAVYSKGGTLLTSTEEVIGRWKEHFEELLNPTTPSMQSYPNNSPPEPRGSRPPPARGQNRSAPVRGAKPPEAVRFVTKDLIRDLRIPGKLSIILPPLEVIRMTESSRVLRKEEKDAMMELLQQRKEADMVSGAVCSVQDPMVSGAVCSVQDPMVSRAVCSVQDPMVSGAVCSVQDPMVSRAVCSVQDPMVSRAVCSVQDPMVSRAVCSVQDPMEAAKARKAQLRLADASRKKNQALDELDVEARDKAQYLLERANAQRMEQEDEVKKLNELILGAQCHAVRDAQVLERQQIHGELLEEERRLDAMMEVNRRRAVETQEQIDTLRKEQMVRGKQQIINQMKERRDEQILQEDLKEMEVQQLRDILEKIHVEELEEEILRINSETIKFKQLKKEQEKMVDLKAMEYTQQKVERDRDYKADQDELHAQRNHRARLEQVVHKEHLLAVEAGRERSEFERVLRAQQEAISRQQEEEAGQRRRALCHADAIREQLRERERLAVAQRREVFQEREVLDEVARQRRTCLDQIREKKLMDLKATGLPEKYCIKVERKVEALALLSL